MKIPKYHSNTTLGSAPIIATTNTQAAPHTLSQQDLDFTQFRGSTDTSKESNLPPVQLMAPNIHRSLNTSTSSNSNTNKPSVRVYLNFILFYL